MMRNYHEVDGQPAGRWRLETLVTVPALLGDPILNRDAALASGDISAEEFDKIVVPAQMVGNPHKDLGLS